MYHASRDLTVVDVRDNLDRTASIANDADGLAFEIDRVIPSSCVKSILELLKARNCGPFPIAEIVS